MNIFDELQTSLHEAIDIVTIQLKKPVKVLDRVFA